MMEHLKIHKNLTDLPEGVAYTTTIGEVQGGGETATEQTTKSQTWGQGKQEEVSHRPEDQGIRQEVAPEQSINQKAAAETSTEEHHERQEPRQKVYTLGQKDTEDKPQMMASATQGSSTKLKSTQSQSS